MVKVNVVKSYAMQVYSLDDLLDTTQSEGKLYQIDPTSTLDVSDETRIFMPFIDEYGATVILIINSDPYCTAPITLMTDFEYWEHFKFTEVINSEITLTVNTKST